MNDLKLINTIQRCLDYGYPERCETCFYNGKDRCSNIMMQDAVTVLKMQCDALNGFSEELEKLKKENALLKTTARFSFDEPKLVRAVNNIIRDVYAATDESSGEDDYLQMIDTMLMFCKMLPSKYHVLITDFKNAPELVKR